ncbi:hypothetical protein DOTSEDRAFT_108738, partial [Dothistroma septosporum NZE10]
FEKELAEYVEHERERGVFPALRDACEASSESVHGDLKEVRRMDVWIAEFF